MSPGRESRETRRSFREWSRGFPDQWVGPLIVVAFAYGGGELIGGDADSDAITWLWLLGVILGLVVGLAVVLSVYVAYLRVRGHRGKPAARDEGAV